MTSLYPLKTQHTLKTQYTLKALLINILSIIGLLLAFSTAHADGDSAEGASWYLSYGEPNVMVSVIDSKITAQVWDNIPSTELQTINSLLWSEHKDNYIIIKDFNKDGLMDIAIMKGAGYGGNDICYAVYEYEPIVYSYRDKASMTICQ